MKAVVARFLKKVVGVREVGSQKGHFAVVANDGVGFPELGIDADAFIKDKTFALIVVPSDEFEIFQNASVQLVDVLEALHLHERACFFAANSTSTEHDNGLGFERGVEFMNRLREIAEVMDVGIQRALEGAQADLIFVSDVEKSDGAFFVQPLFEFLGRNLGSGVAGGVDPLDPKADDLLLDFDEHSLKRLIGAKALFGANGRQAGDGADDLENGIELRGCPGEEKIDSLGSEENGAFDSMVEALCFEKGFPVLQMIKRGKLIAGEVDDFPIHEEIFAGRERGWQGWASVCGAVRDGR